MGWLIHIDLTAHAEGPEPSMTQLNALGESIENVLSARCDAGGYDYRAGAVVVTEFEAEAHYAHQVTKGDD